MSLTYQHANQIHRNSSDNTLWLGDFSAADDINWIRQKNIRTVITAADGLKVKYDSSVRHYHYPILDLKTQNIFQYFDSVSEKIQRSMRFGSVLVHCGAGVSRSASLVIAFLIKFHKMSFITALKYTRNRRKQICPNLGFQLQLKKYDDFIHPKLFRKKKEKEKNESLPLISTSKKSSLKYSKTKFNVLNSTVYNRSENTSPFRKEHPLMKSGSRQGKIQSQIYLKKIAQFRFGRTNISKWGLN